MKSDTIQPRERGTLWQLLVNGPASRLELARVLGVTPNAAGDLAAGLIERGILRECRAEVKGRGRPAVPLEIDSSRKHVLGIALQRGTVQVVKLNLLGQPLGPAKNLYADDARELLKTVTRITQQERWDDTLAAGLSVTGFVDLEQRKLLLSSLLGGSGEADLRPLYRDMGSVPLYIQNDMHALAGRWLLSQRRGAGEDSLLVLLADGQVGSTLLVRGRPNDGCVGGGNELGHMRLPVVTDLCYCGHGGCVERIFSSEYVRARLGLVGSLEELIRDYDGGRSPLCDLISLMAGALANVVNFIRPHRLVLISEFSAHAAFTGELLKRTREGLLPALSDRVNIDLWQQPAASPAETAGYLPLAAMYLDGWS